MRASLIRPAELGATEIEAWKRFCAADPALASPYLSPGFVRLAAEVRPAVRVAVLEDGGRLCGFLPLEVHGGVGRPVCRGLSDVQALLADPAWSCDAREMLRHMRLSMLAFTFLRAGQPPFARHQQRVVPSHVVSIVPDGADGDSRALRADADWLRGRSRRLERQVGPVRLVMQDPDPRLLHRLLSWKSAQYRANGIPDIFAKRWTVELLERLQAVSAPDFAGMLSTLWAGDRLVAAHIGMRSARVLHWWFPAYDRDAARHSPGRILLQQIAGKLGAAGIASIELGAGDEPYKLEVADTAFPVAEAVIARPSAAMAAWRLRRGVEGLARRLPIGPAAEWPSKLFFRLDRWRRLR